MIRVMAVGDRPVVLQGVRALLAEESDFEVVGTAGTCEQALDLARHAAPDVAIIDPHVSEHGDVDLIGGLRRCSPLTECLALTTADDEGSVRRTLGNGARGYLLEGASGEQVRLAVRRVSAGHMYIDASVSEFLVPSSWSRDTGSPGLTRREREVLRLAAQGFTNDSIGARLELGSETVKTHLSRAFAKLGAKDRANAVAIAMRRHLI